jgi:RNA polymerase sigma-70 factor (ECF subfamily)
MADTRTDEELLEAVRTRRDRQALEALLERHEPAIWRFGLKMCRDPEDAKDVLQETMLAAARTAAGFRGASSISTWLFAIARSFCIKKRRHGKFAPDKPVSIDDAPMGATELTSSGPTPDDAVATKQLGEALERAIGELEPSQREVVLLRDVEGLSAPEVADVLGIGVQAVKSRLHRARAELRDLLTPLMTEPGAGAGSGCRDVLPVFSRYLEGEIGPDECARMQEHVDACPRCKGACETLRETLSLCRTKGRGGSVPPAVQELVRRALRDLAASAR